MQRLEVSGAVRPIYGSLGVKRLNTRKTSVMPDEVGCFPSEMYAKSDSLHFHTAIFPTEKKKSLCLITNIYVLKEF